MMKRTKTIVLAGAAALALAGASTGVAFAQPPSPSPSPHGPGRHQGSGFGRGPGGGGLGGGGFGFGFGGQIEHGEATVDTANNTTQVIDIQHGTVTSADSGTLTVQSADGFSATYTVDSSTKISKNRQTSDISQVATNDEVNVVAINANGTLTAQRINDTGPAQ